MTAKKYKHDGKSLTIPQWARETGLPQGTLVDRVKNGWEIERALTTPSDQVANRPNVGRELHGGILASLKKVWAEKGREAFEKQLGECFDKDAIATVLKFQNLLPRIVETDKQDNKPSAAIQINNVIDPRDFKHFRPLGGQ